MGLFLLTGELLAQTDVYPTPYPYNPATPPSWGNTGGFAPVPTNPTPPTPGIPPAGTPGYTEDSAFVPTQPTPGYDYFEDEEDSYSATTPGGSRGKREVKDSFRMVSPGLEQRTCKKWENPMLGPGGFSDKIACEIELGKKMDNVYASIDDTTESFELNKMKKVIKGLIPSRTEAKKFVLSFDSAKRAIQEKYKQGCICSE